MPPKVHTIKKAVPAPALAPEAAQDEASVATTVSLDDIEDVTPRESSVQVAETGSNLTEDDFEDNDPEAAASSTTIDELDDADLSLLDDDEGPSNPGVDAEEQPEEGYLEIYREECLQCRELVPFAQKSYKRKGCHFTSGNKNCPAESTSIVIRVPLEEIIPRWISAEKSRNFSKLSRLTAKLAEKPDWYQQRVAQALEKARKSSN